MDFLGLGIPEVVAIIILALIFIGPRDLPKVAGKFAKFLRDLRMMTEGFRTEWQREINAATRVEGLKELRDELISTRDTLKEAGQDIREAMTIDLEELDEEAEAKAKAKAEAEAQTGETEPEAAEAAEADQPADEPESIQETLEEVGERTIHPPQAEADSQVTAAASEDAVDAPETEEPILEEKPVTEASALSKNGHHTEEPKSPAKVEAAPEPIVEDLPEAIQINLEEPPASVKAAEAETADDSAR